MKSFFSALCFLTTVPFPASWHEGGRPVSSGVYFYPAVGLLLGALLAAADMVLGPFFPVAMSAAFLTALLAVLTGGLHLDGLADTADGFLSWRDGEKTLAIMRDSRIGVMGAIALVLVLLLKTAAIFSLPEGLRWKVLLLAPAAGRCSILFQWSLLPYARKEGGLASLFDIRQVHAAAFLYLLFLPAAALVLLGFRGLAVVIGLGLFILMFSRFARSRIGGVTGDVLGAVCECTETLFLAGMTMAV